MKIGHKLMIRKTLEPVEFRRAFKNGNVLVWSRDKGLLRLHYLELRMCSGRKRKHKRQQMKDCWMPSICKGLSR